MLIGFHGKLGSGKDTAAERLAGMVSVPTERIAFADKLKESAAAALGTTPAILNSLKNNPDAQVVLIGDYEYTIFDRIPRVMSSVTVRQYLQLYGTEAHREIFGTNFWIDAALPDQYDYSDEDIFYLVTDVRFPDELQRVHDLGGIVVRVRGADEETGTHASEQVLEGCDVEIDNSRRGDNYVSLDSQLRMLLYTNGWSAQIAETTSGFEAAA